MTVKQLFDIATSIQELLQAPMPLKKAYEIYQLATSINDKIHFLGEQEKHLIEKYNGEISKNNELFFKNETDQQAFVQEHQKFLNEEFEISPEIILNEEDLQEYKISASAIANLSPIIHFNIKNEEKEIENG